MNDIRKNLLDLYFNKYFYYKNTVIIIFSYFIAVFIILITKQFDYQDLFDTLTLALFSSIVVYVIIFYLVDFNYHLKKIPEEMRNLE